MGSFPTAYVPNKKMYAGGGSGRLAMHYLEGNQDLPAIVLAKGLGLFGKELSQAALLNRMGHTVVFAPYRGTWGSEGEFLSSAEDISVIQDVRDMVTFATEKLYATEVRIGADCFGASPAMIAAAENEKVTGVFAHGGMFFTNDAVRNAVYADRGDYSARLGQQLASQNPGDRKFFNGYTGFDIDVWNAAINGETALNPYEHTFALVDKRILLNHGKEDGLIHWKRSADFLAAINERKTSALRPEASGMFPDGGHRSAFGQEAQAMAASFMTKRPLEETAKLLGAALTYFQPWTEVMERLGSRDEKVGYGADGGVFSVVAYPLLAEKFVDLRTTGIIKPEVSLEEYLNELY